ncbi:hypothetical protein L1987_01071 [Smallanthus sonchifolius]|uniref:Uncharacterized protein n=1 Tax=Smallanthus sonchifolius TaxID=185202 RepID=A0ACB9K3X5_9ASTR|nr:hypothetical protein L1987_01071 [Smallanthus sonchifolius]
MREMIWVAFGRVGLGLIVICDDGGPKESMRKTSIEITGRNGVPHVYDNTLTPSNLLPKRVMVDVMEMEFYV